MCECVRVSVWVWVGVLRVQVTVWLRVQLHGCACTCSGCLREHGECEGRQTVIVARLRTLEPEDADVFVARFSNRGKARPRTVAPSAQR